MEYWITMLTLDLNRFKIQTVIFLKTKLNYNFRPCVGLNPTLRYPMDDCEFCYELD